MLFNVEFSTVVTYIGFKFLSSTNNKEIYVKLLQLTSSIILFIHNSTVVEYNIMDFAKYMPMHK